MRGTEETETKDEFSDDPPAHSHAKPLSLAQVPLCAPVLARLC